MPRTWANLAKLEALNLPDAIESAAFGGAVGDAAATEYLVFRRMVRQLVNLDAILLDPAHAAIPKTKPDQLYAIAVGLAGKANPANFARIVTYCDRLMDADRGEFAVLCIRDAYRRDQSLQHTDTFIKLNCSPLGSLINGATKGGN